MKKTQNLFCGSFTDPIATVVAPLTFLLFVIWTLYFFTTPTPSYFYLNSSVAEIGMRPISNENFIFGQSTKKIYLKEAPFIYDSKIYLPLEAVTLASGIKEEDVVKEKICKTQYCCRQIKHYVSSYTKCIHNFMKWNCFIQ